MSLSLRADLRPPLYLNPSPSREFRGPFQLLGCLRKPRDDFATSLSLSLFLRADLRPPLYLNPSPSRKFRGPFQLLGCFRKSRDDFATSFVFSNSFTLRLVLNVVYHHLQSTSIVWSYSTISVPSGLRESEWYG